MIRHSNPKQSQVEPLQQQQPTATQNTPTDTLGPTGQQQSLYKEYRQNMDRQRSAVKAVAVIDMIQNTFFIMIWLKKVVEIVRILIEMEHTGFVKYVILLLVLIHIFILYLVQFYQASRLWKMTDNTVQYVKDDRARCRRWILMNIPNVIMECGIMLVLKIMFLFDPAESMLYWYIFTLSLSIRCVSIYIVFEFGKNVVIVAEDPN